MTFGRLFAWNYSWKSNHSIELPIPEGSTDSNEDLAEELDEFFRFMIWNDNAGEEASFIEDKELEGSTSATNLFAEFDGFDDIIADDFDDVISDDDDAPTKNFPKPAYDWNCRLYKDWV